MRRAVIVGITGQTGAGKSTVCEMLKKYGYAVIDADEIAALITEKGSPVLTQLSMAFGPGTLNEDGTPNRKVLAQRAFSDPSQTALLNSITHPEIVRLIMKKVNGEFWNGYEAVLIDAPQLFESGLSDRCGFIVSVTAPEELRLSRIIKRDGIDEESARLRMSAQYDENFFIENSDVVIQNNGDDERLKEQILYTARLIETKISGEAE